MYANPTATIAPAAGTVCAGDNLSMTGTAGGGSGVYSSTVWTGTGSGGLSSTTITNPTFNEAASGSYTLIFTVTDSHGCITTSATATETVYANPTATIAPVAGTVCAGDNLSMTGTAGGGSGVYSSTVWTGTGSGGLSSTTITNPTFNEAASGSYTLIFTVTDSHGCITTSATATETVYANPTATIAPAAGTVCAGVNLSMTGTPAGGSGTYSTYAWTGTGSGGLSSTTVTGPTFNEAASGSYTLIFTVTDNHGCIGQAPQPQRRCMLTRQRL